MPAAAPSGDVAVATDVSIAADAIATGAGAGARNSVGTSVAGGMLVSTFLSIFFIPVLYVVIRSLAPGRARRGADDEGPTPVVAAEGGAHA